MRVQIGIGDYIPPPCESISQASSTSCVVVPGITKGTIVMPNTPFTNVWAGQLVDIGAQAQQAYQQNVAAAQAAGGAIMSTAEPGAVNAQGSESPTNAAQEKAAAGDNSWLAVAAAAVAVALVIG